MFRASIISNVESAFIFFWDLNILGFFVGVLDPHRYQEAGDGGLDKPHGAHDAGFLKRTKYVLSAIFGAVNTREDNRPAAGSTCSARGACERT